MKNALRNFVYIFLLAGIGFWGCSDSLVTEPQNEIAVENSSEASLSKTGSIPSELSVKKTINGEKGGIIVLAGLYKNKDGQTITTIATLNIPKGAFEGTREISITTDKSNPVMSFSPDMKFDIPLKLNLSFMGFDLKKLGLSEDNAEFKVINDDGTSSNVINDGVNIDVSTGFLSVKRARIEHFSRFGWTR